MPARTAAKATAVPPVRSTFWCQEYTYTQTQRYITSPHLPTSLTLHILTSTSLLPFSSILVRLFSIVVLVAFQLSAIR
ncbi:hypothetical protein K431DRAFT_284895 [Polychaeton citri CBS 116435]|uniref:Uncharacterized protein n=1 Tax=Polychaeton citri CBS 116435 TaxID=1314669 RepID=A0A9P4Q8G7_9PEZI|nr:hypothetical protein K431DRAFT_284895 [Polychaeton citri CBS 116435]